MTKHVEHLFLEWFEQRTPDRVSVDAHLEQCTRCRNYYERMSALYDPSIFQHLPKLAPSPFLPARIAALAVRQETVERKGRYVAILVSLEGIACVLALVAGIIIGTAVSRQPHRLGGEKEILTMYGSVETDDYTVQLERVLDTAEKGVK